MKASLTIAALILVVGAILGWQEERQLLEIRDHHQRLVAEATSLGLPTDSTGDSAAASSGLSATRSERPPQDDTAATAEARAYASELITFAVKFKAAQESGRPLDEDMQKGIFIHLERLTSLDAGQLRVVIEEVKSSPSLEDDMRRGIVGISINLLADRYPESALIIATEAADILGGDDQTGHVIAGALAKWAGRDPLAALDWLRQNADQHSEINAEEAANSIIRGAAALDPRLAVQLLDDLDIKDPAQATRAIADTAQSSEQRSALLGALRTRAGSPTDADRTLLDSTLKSLAGQMARESFDASANWIDQNKLSADETAAFAAGLTYHRATRETGRWLDWMTDKLPAEQLDQKVRSMVSQWARDDYAAAGTWLNDATGPARIPAVGSFAETVAPYEPETAANWALTLPAGEDRTGLLKNIHNHWKSQDQAAAARFAEQHGLDE